MFDLNNLIVELKNLNENRILLYCNIILAFTAVVGIFLSAISSFLTYKTLKFSENIQKEQLLIDRATIDVIEPKFVQINNKTKLIMGFMMKNIGRHNASQFHYKSILISPDISSIVMKNEKYYDVSLPPNENFTVTMPVEMTNLNFPPHFLVVGVAYNDELLNKKFNNCFFLQTDTVINGSFDPRIFVVTKETREKILNNAVIRNELKEFL